MQVLSRPMAWPQPGPLRKKLQPQSAISSDSIHIRFGGNPKQPNSQEVRQAVLGHFGIQTQPAALSERDWYRVVYFTNMYSRVLAKLNAHAEARIQAAEKGKIPILPHPPSSEAACLKVNGGFVPLFESEGYMVEFALEQAIEPFKKELADAVQAKLPQLKKPIVAIQKALEFAPWEEMTHFNYIHPDVARGLRAFGIIPPENF